MASHSKLLLSPLSTNKVILCAIYAFPFTLTYPYPLNIVPNTRALLAIQHPQEESSCHARTATYVRNVCSSSPLSHLCVCVCVCVDESVRAHPQVSASVLAHKCHTCVRGRKHILVDVHARSSTQAHTHTDTTYTHTHTSPHAHAQRQESFCLYPTFCAASDAWSLFAFCQLSIVEMAARLRVERLVLQGVARERCDGEKEKEIARVSQALLDTFHHLLLSTGKGGRGRGETWLAHLRTLEGYVPAPGERRFVTCGSSLGQTAHSLLVDKQGCIWSFGAQNDDGRLGLGDSFPRLSPHRISPHHLPPIASVSCGGMSRSALGWGSGDGGSGKNQRIDSSCLKSSAQLDFTPRGENLAVQHAGFSAAVSVDGKVFVWGDSAHGCLGLGHVQVCFMPRTIPALAKYVVHQVAAGGAHCLAVTRGGEGGERRVFGWGLGKFGQLGTGKRIRHMMPVEIEGLRHECITSVVAAGSFSGFLSSNGAVWMCGCGWDGQLGLGDRDGRLLPEMVTNFNALDHPLEDVSRHNGTADVQSSVADDDDDQGSDGSGEDCGALRSYDRHQRRRPAIATIAAGSADVLSQSRTLISTGFVVAVDTNGGVWSWGEGRFGQLGHGDTEERLYPTRVEALRGVRIRSSAAGGRHSALVSEAGVVWTAGAGREGQLGYGSMSLQFSSQFQRVDGLLFGRAVISVAAGLSHTLAVDDTGDIFAWGGESYGITGISGIGMPGSGASGEEIGRWRDLHSALALPPLSSHTGASVGAAGERESVECQELLRGFASRSCRRPAMLCGFGEPACGFVAHLSENLWAKQQEAKLKRKKDREETDGDRYPWSGGGRVMGLVAEDAGGEESEGAEHGSGGCAGDTRHGGGGLMQAPRAASFNVPQSACNDCGALVPGNGVAVPSLCLSGMRRDVVGPFRAAIFAVSLGGMGGEKLKRPLSRLAPECPPKVVPQLPPQAARLASRLSRTYCPRGAGSCQLGERSRRATPEGSKREVGEMGCRRSRGSAGGLAISCPAGDKDSMKTVQAPDTKLSRRKRMAEDGTRARERNHALGRIGGRVFGEFRRVMNRTQETMVAPGHWRGGSNMSRFGAAEGMANGHDDGQAQPGRAPSGLRDIVESQDSRGTVVWTDSIQGEKRSRLQLRNSLRCRAPWLVGV